MRYAITLSALFITPLSALAGACDPATQFPDAPAPIPFSDFIVGVASGDFNSDGIPDVAVTLPALDEVHVLIGNGDGTLTTASTITVGLFPNPIEAADLNADGRDDIVCVNTNDNTLSVLLGNGDATFQPAATYSASAVLDNLDSFDIGDLDGDGVLDIIAAGSISSGLAVFLGVGNGTFQAALFTGSSTIVEVSIGHFNDDGHADIAFITNSNSRLRVALGNGDGTFQPESNSLNPNTNGIQTADLDGDGRDDLVASDTISDQFVVRLSNGDGTFAPPSVYPAGDDPRTMVITDLNNDATPDLAGINESSATLSVLIGNGDGTFQSQNQFLTVGASFGLVAADYNADGAPDLLISDFINNALRLFTNACGPFTLTFAAHPQSIVTEEGIGALFLASIVQDDPTATFQWRRDGVALTDGPDISGAQSTVLVLSNVTGADVGVYDVIATNDIGSTPSDPAVLAVRVGPDCPGDTDGSTVVDFNDLVATLFLFGPCPE